MVSIKTNVDVPNQQMSFPRKKINNSNQHVFTAYSKKDHTHSAFLYKMELLGVEMLCISIKFKHKQWRGQGYACKIAQAKGNGAPNKLALHARLLAYNWCYTHFAHCRHAVKTSIHIKVAQPKENVNHQPTGSGSGRATSAIHTPINGGKFCSTPTR